MHFLISEIEIGMFSPVLRVYVLIKIGRTVLGELWLTMKNCTVISKKEILYLGPFGLACWLWGTVFIDRKNVEESRQMINDTAESIRVAKVILRNYDSYSYIVHCYMIHVQ